MHIMPDAAEINSRFATKIPAGTQGELFAASGTAGTLYNTGVTIASINSTAQGYATTAENNAKSDATTKIQTAIPAGTNNNIALMTGTAGSVKSASVTIAGMNSTAQGYANTAESNAKSYADGFGNVRTTAPTANWNTADKSRFVYLTSEPSVRYTGWIYIIGS